MKKLLLLMTILASMNAFALTQKKHFTKKLKTNSFESLDLAVNAANDLKLKAENKEFDKSYLCDRNVEVESINGRVDNFHSLNGVERFYGNIEVSYSCEKEISR